MNGGTACVNSSPRHATCSAFSLSFFATGSGAPLCPLDRRAL
jgi:hypothetical protein